MAKLDTQQSKKSSLQCYSKKFFYQDITRKICGFFPLKLLKSRNLKKKIDLKCALSTDFLR